MIKADDKVKIDNEKQNYTYFEELMKRVEILQDMIEDISYILRENDIHRKEKVNSPEFDENRLYEELEEKDEN